ALPPAAQEGPGGTLDRDQGAPRRLDQRHPVAVGGAPDQRPRGRLADRPRPAARLRPAAPGPFARRPPRLLRRGGRGRRRGGRAAAPPRPPRLTRARGEFAVIPNYRG